MNNREKIIHSAFMGRLVKDSPLRKIFPSGCVPLAGPHSVMAVLGEGENQEVAKVYFVLMDACTHAQKEAIAELMHDMGQGSLEEARKTVAIEETIPIREMNISGMTFPFSYTREDHGNN
jgi:hypothetical protein